MKSAELIYQVWLRLQCQLIAQIQAASLYRHQQPELPQISVPQLLAQWSPAAETQSSSLNTIPESDTAWRDAATAALAKGRLHLQPLDEQRTLVASPLKVDAKLWGVLVLQLESAAKQQLPQILTSLHTGQQWLQFMQLLESEAQAANLPEKSDNSAAHLADSTGQWPVTSDQAMDLVSCLLQETSAHTSAIALVNFLATRLRASRVSLGFWRGRRLQLEAISFTANFDPRAQAMEQLRQVMYEAWDQGRDLRLNPAVEPAADQLLKAHGQLLQQQQLQQVDTRLVKAKGEALGVVVCEFAQAPPTGDQALRDLDSLAYLAGQLLRLQLQADSPWYRRMGKSLLARLKTWLGPERTLAKLGLAGALALVVALFIPSDYEVNADVQLHSAYKYLLVSPQDGFLAEINSRPGDKVSQGQVLAQLKAEDLQLERRKLLSQIDQQRQTYDRALAKAERVEAAIAEAQMEQVKAQLELVEQQLQRIQLRAPVAGIVVSEDITQNLGAPVKQGDRLFEIAADQGYRLLLFIDERDISAVTPGQSLRVKLTSLPDQDFTLELTDITPISELRQGRNYFRAQANMPEANPRFRPGMTGSARIAAGRRPLGWIWLHSYWDWLRLHLW